MRSDTIDNINSINEYLPFVAEYAPEKGYDFKAVNDAIENTARLIQECTGVDVGTEESLRDTYHLTKGNGDKKRLILASTALVKKILLKTYDHKGDPSEYITNGVDIIFSLDDVLGIERKISDFISKDTTDSNGKYQPPNLMPVVFNECFPAINRSSGSVDDVVMTLLKRATQAIEDRTYEGFLCFDHDSIEKTKDDLLECFGKDISLPFSDYDELWSQIRKEGPCVADKHYFDRLSWKSNAKSDATKVTFHAGQKSNTLIFRAKMRNNKIKEYLLSLGKKILSEKLDTTGDTSYLISCLHKHW